MSDKKRKNDPEAVQPEGKKARKEEKKDKKDKKEKKAKDVVDEVKEVKEEKKDKKDKKEKKEKKEKKREEQEQEQEQEPEKEEKEEKKKDKKEKKEKKEKKDKKEKRDEQQETPAEADAMDVDEQQPEEQSDKKDKKKDKKSKKEKKEKTSESQPELTAESQPTGKQNRFIVFVGNLPYSANAESLKKHFEKNPPASVRVATEKEKPTKCRGFGFIEFDHFDRMKTCLKLYHHSMFDDGKYPPRRINVELTAGGGGKSNHRTAKIEAKNKKLAEERQQSLHKEKERKAEVQETGGDDYAGVHPSRRNRMA